MDDEVAISTFLNSRDPSAFAWIVREYQNRVFRLAVSILGPGLEEDAREVTQEVFVRVYRHLVRFEGKSQFSSWLYRIAHNCAIDRKRSARLRHPHEGEERLCSIESRRLEDSPEEQLAARRQREAIDHCLEELPGLYRSVLHLFYWSDQSVVEISELLGAPVNTVKSYLHRARLRLGECLKKKGVADASGL